MAMSEEEPKTEVASDSVDLGNSARDDDAKKSSGDAENHAPTQEEVGCHPHSPKPRHWLEEERIRIAVATIAAALVWFEVWEPFPGLSVIGVVKLVFGGDRKSTRLNSSHVRISYAVFCLKKKTEALR